MCYQPSLVPGSGCDNSGAPGKRFLEAQPNAIFSSTHAKSVRRQRHNSSVAVHERCFDEKDVIEPSWPFQGGINRIRAQPSFMPTAFARSTPALVAFADELALVLGHGGVKVKDLICDKPINDVMLSGTLSRCSLVWFTLVCGDPLV